MKYVILYGCLFIAIYPYFIYPVTACLVGRLRSRQVLAKPWSGSVAVVIAAHNESRTIAAALKNKLRQRVEGISLKVIVVSDASTDNTDAVVEQIAKADPRVTLIRQERRRGKTAALNAAFESVWSDVIVFSDANSIYEEDAIEKLVRNFSDPSVGYVTGEMSYSLPGPDPISLGAQRYMTYENRLRQCENKVGSIVGVDGGIDAVRTSLFVPMRDDQLPDFALPLDVIRRGYRVVFEPGAKSVEEDLTSVSDELNMRVRVITRAWWTLIEYVDLINPFRYGWFAWQLFSHKWLRYLSFAPLTVAAVMTALTLDQSALSLALGFAALVIVIAGIGAMLSSTARKKCALCRLSFYFVLLLVAQARAIIKVAAGERYATWRPRAG